MSELYILGCKIDDISLQKALRKVKGFFDDRDEPGYIVTPNPEICLKAEPDQDYQKVLNNAFLSLPDGFGLKIGAMLLGQRLKNIITKLTRITVGAHSGR